ncbi:MAG TPA: hypothetical protein VFC24_09835 [Casimicrobiaceae bacterium]|nr:hypothetical protein [Casimicrobiaceae bacterium]
MRAAMPDDLDNSPEAIALTDALDRLDRELSRLVNEGRTRDAEELVALIAAKLTIETARG